MVPTEAELADAIQIATRNAVRELVRMHPEKFYYITLTTTGEAHAPVLSAWSEEALGAVAAKDQNPEQARCFLKWSYADSPYLFFGEHHYQRVRDLFGLRPRITWDMTASERTNEFQTRLRAMETAMRRLDAEGLFGEIRDRTLIMINVEVMPPDHTNTQRARRLNPPDALHEWLAESAEPDDR